jgi:hypothetical protein
MKTLSEYRVELGVKTELSKKGEARNDVRCIAMRVCDRGVQIGREQYVLQGRITYRVFADPSCFDFDQAVDAAIDAGYEHYATADGCIEDFDFDVLKVELVDTGIVIGASLA